MGAIEKLSEGIWVRRFEHRMAGMEVGTRSTLLRLPSGGLLLISPGPFDEEEFAEVAALGKVEALVAPNTFHHLFFRRAAERYPEARRYYAPGLREKVPSLPEGEILSEEAPAIWGSALEQILIEGLATNEVVFFHPSSRTLILTDLAFNIRSGGLWTKLAMRLNGGFGRFGPTKVLRSSIRDPLAFNDSLREIAGWDFERIVLAHGEALERGGRALFCQAFGLDPEEMKAEPPPGDDATSLP